MPHYIVTHACGCDRQYRVEKYAHIREPFYQARQARQRESDCGFCWRKSIRDEVTAKTSAVPITGVSEKQIAFADRVRGDALEVLVRKRDEESESSPRRAQLDAAIKKISGTGSARWLLDTLPHDYYRFDSFATDVIERQLIAQFVPAVPEPVAQRLREPNPSESKCWVWQPPM